MSDHGGADGDEADRTNVDLDGLRAIVGANQVLVGDATLGHTTDWTGRFQGSTPAVVRPGSVDEVAAVLRWCGDHGIAVVPQGGNTGLVGASVPLAGEVVVSLRRLDQVTNIDADEGQLTAQAGATIAAVQQAAIGVGWRYGVDWGARDSATVGGSIATNAGGLRVLRYGDTRAQVLGVEAVLADGSVVRHLDGLRKDNTGYHLPSLLCGSEGTLAVVTAARLRLVPAYDARVVALLAMATIDAAAAAAGRLRRTVADLDACELVLQPGLDLVTSTFGLAPPFGSPHAAYLLVEAAATSDPTEALAAAIAELDGVVDVAVATDSVRRAELWRYREGHTEAINTIGPPHKLDVTLPAAQLARFAHDVVDVVAARWPEARCWLFGHAGDGNVHVNVTGVDPDDDEVDDAVFGLVAARGGSISAEHGIGTAKRRWLHLNRTPEELAVFRSIKHALDPAGTLSPHTLLP